MEGPSVCGWRRLRHRSVCLSVVLWWERMPWQSGMVWKLYLKAKDLACEGPPFPWCIARASMGCRLTRLNIWVSIGKQLCKGIAVLTQLYCLIHINMSTTCFGLYGHRQVGYSIRGKLHNIIWHRINICVYTQIFVLNHMYFSSDIVSNLTMPIKAETCSWHIYMYQTI